MRAGGFLLLFLACAGSVSAARAADRWTVRQTDADGRFAAIILPDKAIGATCSRGKLYMYAYPAGSHRDRNIRARFVVDDGASARTVLNPAGSAHWGEVRRDFVPALRRGRQVAVFLNGARFGRFPLAGAAAALARVGCR
jgi:hypothetical protein